MSPMKLADANKIITAAFAKASELGLKPLGVVVVDAGGHTVSVQRQDGSPFMRIDIAGGKAYGAVAFGSGTRRLNALAQERPHFVNAFVASSGGKAMPVPGGVLVKTTAGEVIGAVGISGDTSDNDELCAIAGIEAAGFVGDGG